MKTKNHTKRGKTTKRCPTCTKPKILDDFYKNRSRPDGVSSQCKLCCLAYQKRHSQTDGFKAKKRKWDTTYLATPRGKRVHAQARNAYSKTEKGREVNRTAALIYSEDNPEKRKAQQILNNAIRDGKIERPERCAKCDEKKFVEAHHEDYSKPLDVDWWCKKCHTAYHIEQRRLAREN